MKSSAGISYIPRTPAFGRLSLLLCLLLFVSASSACAGDESPEEASGGPPGLSVDFSFEHVRRAAAPGLGVSASHDEYTAGLRWFFLFLRLNHREYDWRIDPDGSGGEKFPPWESLTALTPGFSYYRGIGESSGVIVNLFGTYGFEEELSSGTLSYNTQAFVLWAYRPRVTLFTGVGMRYHPVSSSFYPMLGFSWEGDAGSGFYGFLGNPSVLGYRLNDSTAFNLNVESENWIYRLSEENSVSPRGYLRDSDWKISVSVEKGLTENLTLSAGISRFLDRSISIYDREGDRTGSADIESGFSFNAGMSYSF